MSAGVVKIGRDHVAIGDAANRRATLVLVLGMRMRVTSRHVTLAVSTLHRSRTATLPWLSLPCACALLWMHDGNAVFSAYPPNHVTYPSNHVTH